MVELGDAENDPPPLILYSTLNPAIAGTAGNVNMEAHELLGSKMTGAGGKTTPFAVPS